MGLRDSPTWTKGKPKQQALRYPQGIIILGEWNVAKVDKMGVKGREH
jgi:hypothetical protein